MTIKEHPPMPADKALAFQDAQRERFNDVGRLRAERNELLALVERTARLHPNDICGVKAAELLARLQG